MILPRNKPRPSCKECFFCSYGRCIEDSPYNHYSGTRRHPLATACDYFLYKIDEASDQALKDSQKEGG